MPETERIVVYGEGEVAHGLAVVLREWGHTQVSEQRQAEAIARDTSVCWLAFDTPVTPQGKANVGWVRERLDAALPRLHDGTLVVITSPVPVGFAREIHRYWPSLDVVSIPELVRRQQAEHGFRNPDVIAIGLLPETNRERILDLYAPRLHERIVWMSLESAEMTKHATNCFLATELVFANVIAQMCAYTGANYADVERALRRDLRIGWHAYIRAGRADGSHLLRDVRYLLNITPELALLNDVVGAPVWES